MASFQCPYCHGWEIYKSSFRWIDLLCLPMGSAHRCHTCGERFYSWRKSPPRQSGTATRADIPKLPEPDKLTD